jgi:PAS domain S-box-containing protein
MTIDSQHALPAGGASVNAAPEPAEMAALFRAMLEQQAVGIAHTDLTGRFLLVNDRYAEITGRSRQELLGMRMQEITHPDDLQANLALFQRMASGGADFLIEKRYVRPDGSCVWVNNSVSAVRRPDGTPEYTIAISQDITARKRAEQQLAEVNESLERKVAEFETLLHVLPVGIGIAADPECRTIRVNPAFAASLRLNPEDNASKTAPEGERPTTFRCIGQDGREVPGDELPMQVAARDGRSVAGVELDVVHDDGSTVRLLEYAEPLFESDGTPRGSVGVFVDITEKKRAEDALREEKRTLETVNRVGMILAGELDLQKLIQGLTEAGTEITGAEFGAFFYNTVGAEGEAYMLYTLSGVPREAFEGFPMPRNTAVFGATFRGEAIVRLDDVTRDPRYGKNPPYHGLPEGHLPVRSYLAAPVVSRGGEVLGGLFFGHSQVGVFTRRHEAILRSVAAQAAIAIDNARLYQQATAELIERKRAEEALREADRRKDEFLAMLAHELRNPLAPIRTANRILQEAGPADPLFERNRGIIERQVEKMARLVDDLLDVSRITRGQVRLERGPADLREVVAHAVEAAHPLIEAQGHELSLCLPEAPVVIEADRLRLEQVVTNLLNNAARYTDCGGRITAELQRAGSEAVLRVRDTGRGIGPELLPHVFELFTQGERGLDRSQGGVGIGLTLVKRLVELHGGTVDAMSDGPGRGAEFIVRLPIGTALDEEGGANRPDPHERSAGAVCGSSAAMGRSRRVLVVDDNRDGADALVELLELWGYEAHAVYDGARALEAARRLRPAVVFLDIGMPGTDGYQVARQLRGDPELRSAALVALTGYGRSEDRERAAEAGFDLHLTKPVDPRRIRAFLSERR